MQASNNESSNANDNGRSNQSVVGLSLTIATALSAVLMLNSCGTYPTPDQFHPIPEPMTIPTPAETTDNVLPDPVDVQDFNNTPEPSIPTTATTPTAKSVPGRPGFVFNPFTQNMVDVEGIPAGTKVRDPQDSNEAHTFYVP